MNWLALALLAATSWPQLLHGPDHWSRSTDASISQANAPAFGIKWMANLYSAALDSAVVAYNPAFSKMVVYTGNQRADLFAIDASTGKTLWSTNLGVGDRIQDTPAVSADGQSIWVGTSIFNATLYKISTATGAIECSVQALMPIDGSPMDVKLPNGSEMIYWVQMDGTYQGPLTATNASDCSQSFSFSTYNTFSGSWTTPAYAVTRTGTPLILIGTADPDSREYAINASTGALVWSYQSDNPGGDYDIGDASTISPPGKNGITDGAVYFNNKYGYEYGLDLQTGALLWRFAISPSNYHAASSRSSGALDGNTLVFGYGQDSGTGGSGGVYAVNAANGNQLWQFTDPVEVLSSPAIIGASGSEVVSFGDLAGNFYLMNPSTGSVLYKYATPGYFTSSPAESNGTIFIPSGDGFLYAFAPNGTSGAAPSTAITSPAPLSSQTNPNGSLVISGTSSVAAGVAAVQVAVQTNGVSGPWYDATHGTYNSAPVANQAVLASPLASTTAWSFSLPVPSAGGTFRIIADSVSRRHIVDHGASVSFTVKPSTTQPSLALSSTYVPPGASVRVSATAFSPGDTVTFSLLGATVATVTADSSGNVPSTKIAVPSWTTFGPTSLSASAPSGKSTTATLFITNNWYQAGHDATHTAFEPQDNSLNRSISVNNSSILGVSWYFATTTAVNSSPSVVDGIVYFGTNGGTMRAVVANTGAPLWKYQTASNAAIRTAPAIDPNGRVLFTSSDGNLYTMSSVGRLLRTTTLGGTLTSPTIMNGQIYVASSSGKLFDVSDTTGAVTWSVALSGAGHSAPAYDASNGIVVAGDDSGAVTAFNASTGTMLWKVQTGGGVVAAPVIAFGQVFAGSEDGQLYAIAESNGAINWQHPMSGPITAAPVTYEGQDVEAADSNGQVTMMSSTGAFVSNTQTGAAIAGLSAVNNNTLVEQSNGIVGLIRPDGPIPYGWTYQTNGTLSTSPTIVDGTVYVGAGDHGVYAFTPEGANPLVKTKHTTISVSDANAWSCTTP